MGSRKWGASAASALFLRTFWDHQHPPLPRSLHLLQKPVWAPFFGFNPFLPQAATSWPLCTPTGICQENEGQVCVTPCFLQADAPSINASCHYNKMLASPQGPDYETISTWRTGPPHRQKASL